MDQDSAHMVAASKVPMLKPGVETTIAPTTTEEKAQRRLELKARSTLLMGIPNEHQLKFNSIKDAKSFLQAIEKSQLEIHSESISQEDVNQKFLRSLSPEWNTHTIMWRNKPEIDTLSLDDLYNNMKIYDHKSKGHHAQHKQTKRAVVSSDSTNQYKYEQLNTAHDLQQMHPEELDEWITRWRMVMLTNKAKRFLNNTRRKLTVNGNETIGFDKFKVECYNCHKRGYFARECRASRNQENKNRENTRRVVPVETTTSNALVYCDGSGYDWSDQAEKGPTNFALMAYSSTSSNSEVSTDSNCLESVEARVLVYKKNKSVYEEDVKVLKREIHLREVAITELRRKLELPQKQKDEIQLTVENFKNSSKKLSKLIDCQIVDKCKIGLGYNVVPPPYTGNFMPLKPDLSFSGLEEFVNEPIVSEPTVKKHVVEISEAKASIDKPKSIRKNNDAPIVEDWVSNNEEDDVPQAKIEIKTFKPSFAKIEFVKPKQQEKIARKTANHVEQNRKNIHIPRGNQRNWNNMMSQRLGSNFKMFNKACYVCGSFDHLQVDCKKVNQKQFQNTKPIWNNAKRVNHHSFTKKTHPCPKKNMVPRAVLMKSGLVSLNTARQVNTAHPKITMNSARTMTNLSKSAHSTVKPKEVVNVARPKAVVNAVKGNNVNDVKASACWVWKPKTKVLDHGNPQIDLQDQGVIDSGCSRHMTGNMSYLTDYEEIDGGYVAFGGNPKGGKITGRVPRKNNMYSVDLKNIVPKGGLTCLFAKATSDESELWHRRLGHINFKTMNKLVKGNLVRGLPSKLFENNQTCVACQKGKQHRSSVKPALGGKFNGKADEGFFVGYSTNSKAFRVFNSRTRIVEENLHVQFSENTPNIAGSGPNWLFDIDALTKSMNYKPVVAGNQSNGSADQSFSSSLKDSPNAGFKPSGKEEKKDTEEPRKEVGNPSEEGERVDHEKDASVNNTNTINTVSPTVNVAGIENNVVDESIVYSCADDPNMHELEEIGIFSDAEDDNSGADMNNLDTYFQVSHVLTTRIHKDHPLEQVIGDLHSAPQTRRMTMNLEEHSLFSSVHQRTNHKDFQNCLFACFLSQEEPKKVVQALKDPSWIEAMQEELLQFKLQEVWTLVELPKRKRAIGTKWVFRNKKDEKGIVIKNKARLVAQGYTQEEGIDYDEVFAPVARIEAIRLFLAYASFKDFVVYQMDVKSAFLYSKIEKEVYVCQTPGFEDPDFPDRVYKVEKALYGLHQAPRAWYETLSTYLLDNGFQRGKIDKTLFIKRDKSDILLVQVYADDIIFGSTRKKMPDIMFAVCACVRFQVNPKISHLHYVKRIFRYLKGQPKLGLWYPKNSPFDLVAYTDSDYVGASLDRKSTTGGCQFLGFKLISWQCKKQTVVANSTTKAEYIAASSCCGHSTICIVKNPIFHSKTENIEIRHHFIRDSNKKKLIQMIKIHTDQNVVDLLTKAFDVSRFQYLIACIGMLNL
ncbi:putative ribonuclease H-like domain-containing protein [Tanacetum coccineum]